MREQLGLNKPLYQQYLIFLGNALHGDLGRSILRQEPVTQEIIRRFPATIELALAAILIALVVGIPAGVISAVRRGSWFDMSGMLVALTGVSMPIFWLGLMLIFLFSVVLHVLPTGGRMAASSQFVPITNLLLLDTLLRGDPGAFFQVLRHLVLPAVALGTIPMAIIARMTRSAMLEVLSQDYIRTAHAKGLKERTVVMRHALRNAWLPVITVVGLQVGRLLSGAILTETVFSWPGIGRWLVDAIFTPRLPNRPGRHPLHRHHLCCRQPDRGRLVRGRGPADQVRLGLGLPTERCPVTGAATITPGSDTGSVLSRPPRSLWRDAWRRLSSNHLARLGMAITLLFLFMAIFVPIIFPYNARIDSDLVNQLVTPSRGHLMGTDEQGRDVLNRVAQGARASLGVGVSSVLVAILIGSLLGLVSGFTGKTVDLVIMFAMDIMLSFPGLLARHRRGCPGRSRPAQFAVGHHRRQHPDLCPHRALHRPLDQGAGVCHRRALRGHTPSAHPLPPYLAQQPLTDSGAGHTRHRY